MIKLISITPGVSLGWELKPGKYIIGRGINCDLRVKDTTVSREHAEIIVGQEQTAELWDLESHYGTLVNGNKIGNITLNIGDVINLGKMSFKIIKQDEMTLPAGNHSLSEIEYDLTNATITPLSNALAPLPVHVFDNPKLFECFSEMGKMLVIPELGNEIYDKALLLLSELLPAERLALFFTGDEAEGVRLAAQRTKAGKSSDSFVMSRTILNHLTRQRSAVLLPNLLSDQRFKDQQSVINSGAKAMMAVPLQDEDKIIGILYADSRIPGPEFSNDFLRILATFGNLLATKITNYNLLQERKAKEAMEAELSLASQIQKSLLPKELPNIYGYYIGAFQSQCLAVGGDLYDVALLKDGRIVMLLSDVAGKGAGAALLASNILASFRILYNTDNFHLGEAVELVSDQLLSHSRAGDFATLFAGIFDPKSNRLNYINAGHAPLPLLVRQGGNIEFLESSGLPIGAFKLHAWEERAIEFCANDSLFVFTDGIPEACNSLGEQFGDERTKDFLLEYKDRDLTKLPEALVSELGTYLGCSSQMQDDITMLILKRIV
jgi:phosphoserine phosphatase RsbU/P